MLRPSKTRPFSTKGQKAARSCLLHRPASQRPAAGISQSSHSGPSPSKSSPSVLTAVDEMAARIAVSNFYKNTKNSNFYKNTKKYLSEIIKDMFSHVSERSGLEAPVIADDVHDIIMKNSLCLDSKIIYDRDFDHDYFGFKTLERSCLLKVQGKVVERPQHMLVRVAVGIHKDDIDSVIRTYHLLSHRWFTHSSPNLFNDGTPRPQLSSCFLICMKEDSIEGICCTLKECAVISKSAGGTGVCVHSIFATGSYIRGTSGLSNGIVRMLPVFNDTACYVDQGGGKRKGAFAVYLELWHAPVFEFLDLRRNHGKEEHRASDLFNALWVPNLFMQSVQSNGQWSLFCPNEPPGSADCWGEQLILCTLNMRGRELFCTWGLKPSDGWDWHAVWGMIAKNGVRNSLIIAPIPTASTSQILGNNVCFQPYTSNIYSHRALRTVWEIELHKLVDMAVDRGCYIDQSQILNIHMDQPHSGKPTSLIFHGWSREFSTSYRWNPPRGTTIKCSIDGAIDSKLQRAAGGVIFRLPNCKMLDAFHKPVPFFDCGKQITIEKVDALTLLMAVERATALAKDGVLAKSKTDRVIFETDSSLLFSLFNRGKKTFEVYAKGKVDQKGNIQVEVVQIAKKILILEGLSIKFACVKIYREQNRVADYIARLGIEDNRPRSYTPEFVSKHPHLEELISMDCEGISTVRGEGKGKK